MPRRSHRARIRSLASFPAFLTLLLALGTSVRTARACPATAPATQDAPTCTLTGKLVDGEGRPVAGATLSLKGHPLGTRTGTPPDPWTYPEFLTSSEGGWFTFTFEPPEMQALVLLVTPKEHAQATWFWWELAPGETDLGDLLLRERASVSGTVVDAAGGLLVEGWRVEIQEQVGFGTAREGLRVQVEVDRDTGTWSASDLPAGPVVLYARGPDQAYTERRVVLLEPGANPTQELVHRASETRPGVRVRVSGMFHETMRLSTGSVVAIDEQGRRTPLVPLDSRKRDWEAAELLQGVYRVEVQDPCFEPTHVSDVVPGERAPIELRGRAGLRLEVLDAQGAPVRDLTVIGTLLTAQVIPSESRFTVHPEREPGHFLVRWMVSGDWLVELGLPDGGTYRLVVEDLGEAEVRPLRIDLGALAGLRGRVLDSHGQPLADVRVQRSLGRHMGHDSPHVEGVQSTSVELEDGTLKPMQFRHRDEEVRTDAEGMFRFEGLTPGPHALRAVIGPYVQTIQVVDAPEGATREVELRLPPFGRAEVRVLVPGNVDPADLQLSARPAEYDPLLIRMGGRLDWEWPMLDDDGRCTLEGVPVGRVGLGLSQLVRGDEARRFTAVGGQEVPVTEEGPNVFEVDLRERFPSDGLVRVRLNGEVEPRLQLDLHREADDQDPSTFPARTQPTLDLQAFQVVGAIPGRYRVEVSSPEGWTWVSDERLVVPSNTPFEHEVDLQRVRRTLRLRDARGVPLANVVLEPKSRRSLRAGPPVTTDAEGRLELHLPPCELDLARPVEPGEDPQERPKVRFRFEAGEGDLELVLPD